MGKSIKWTKALGTFGKIVSVLPDTTEIIGKTIDNTRPIIEKELERHHNYKNSFIHLDNVVHLDVSDAKNHLEKQGFIVREILATPLAKYTNAAPRQVVNMVPKTKKAKAGSLIKLYYLNETAINASIILAKDKSTKTEQFGQKVNQSLIGVKNFFPKKKKRTTPPHNK